MIKAFIPSDLEFLKYKTELKKLYEESQEKICDPNDFEFVTKNTLFYGFADENGLIGGIYYFLDSDLLFMNGFAGRKHFLKNVECVKMTLKWFSCDIFAEVQNRASSICLIRAGFKRIKENLFVYKQGQKLGKD